MVEARGLGLRGAYRNVDFTLHAGEILGIAGVIGSGREELSRTLAGFAPHDAGTLMIHERQVVLAREITKLFETIHACALQEAEAWLLSDSDRQRGEFVVLVSGAPPRTGLPAETLKTLSLLLEELPLKQAVQLAAKISGANRNELYQLALQMKEQDHDDGDSHRSGDA